MTGGRRARIADGALASAALLAVLALGAAVGARPVGAAGAIGGVGALAVEALLMRRPDRVRRAWRRPGVRVGSLVAGLALAVVLARYAPDFGLSALAGGLATYLGLLGVVTVGSTSG